MIQKPENVFFKSGLVAACALNGVGKPWGEGVVTWMMSCLEIGLGLISDPGCIDGFPWSLQALHIFFLMIQMFVFYRVSRLHQDEVWGLWGLKTKKRGTENNWHLFPRSSLGIIIAFCAFVKTVWGSVTFEVHWGFPLKESQGNQAKKNSTAMVRRQLSHLEMGTKIIHSMSKLSWKGSRSWVKTKNDLQYNLSSCHVCASFPGIPCVALSMCASASLWWAVLTFHRDSDIAFSATSPPEIAFKGSSVFHVNFCSLISKWVEWKPEARNAIQKTWNRPNFPTFDWYVLAS